MVDRNPKLALFHPFLFALVPVVSLLSHNIDGVPIQHAIRPAALALALALLGLLLAKRLVQTWEHAALLTSLFLMLFFSYGHVYLGLVYEGTLNLFLGFGLVGRHPTLLLAWVGVYALGAFAMHRAAVLRPTMTQLFSVTGLIAVAFPLVQIASHELELTRLIQGYAIAMQLETTEVDLMQTVFPHPTLSEMMHESVLDAYGRSDVLQDIYDYDNSHFVNFLRSQGFFVASQSRSNYLQTELSLSSALNLTYLDFLSTDPGKDSADRTPFARLIRRSRLRELLEQSGYTIVDISTGFRVTALEDADIFLEAPFGESTTLERLLMDTSGLVIIQDLLAALDRPPLRPGYQAHRVRIAYGIEALGSVPSLPGPKFVMAHILVPHPPFVFDEHGNAAREEHPFTLLDGSAYLGSDEEYIQGYRAQITYVDRVMEQAIAAILRESAEPPIILVQGDHGPGSGLDWDSLDRTDATERSAILNAYYLPSVTHEALYPSISPVNSFRLILDLYFGAQLGMLPDNSYFTTWEHPYDFIPIN